jgi:hypothetical protein
MGIAENKQVVSGFIDALSGGNLKKEVLFS